MSYRKAIDALVPRLPRTEAEELLRNALPQRQLEHLEHGRAEAMPGQLELAA